MELGHGALLAHVNLVVKLSTQLFLLDHASMTLCVPMLRLTLMAVACCQLLLQKRKTFALVFSKFFRLREHSNQ
jgi:hypothetical protein